MTERGRIRNKDFKRQIFDMSGLRYGKITPTDIDGFMDFGDKLFIFFESKHGDSGMSYGQNLAFERIVDACQSKGRESVGFVLSHHADTDEIDVASLLVVKYRNGFAWHIPKRQITMKEAAGWFVERYSKRP